MSQAAEGGSDRGERELQQHCAQCAAKDNQRRSRLQNLAKIAAFDEQTGDDAGDGQNDSADARFVHVLLLCDFCRFSTVRKFA